MVNQGKPGNLGCSRETPALSVPVALEPTSFNTALRYGRFP